MNTALYYGFQSGNNILDARDATITRLDKQAVRSARKAKMKATALAQRGTNERHDEVAKLRADNSIA